jgi:hypothetical protein
MRARVLLSLSLASTLVVAACAGRASGPPPMAYGIPDPRAVTYSVADTVTIEISALGQSLSLEARSRALYAVAFERAGDRLRATLTVQDLEAEVTTPMTGPMRVDESVISGRLVLSLDRRGDYTVVESPVVEEAAAPYFSGPTMAGALFPGVPGTVVAQGDSWVDTVAYAEAAETGQASQSSVLMYTVVGDMNANGRALLEVVFEGTSDMSQTMSMQGVDIVQETELAVEGRLLWDVARGLVYESETRSEGEGTVEVSAMPAELPTRVRMRQHVRLEGP